MFNDGENKRRLTLVVEMDVVLAVELIGVAAEDDEFVCFWARLVELRRGVGLGGTGGGAFVMSRSRNGMGWPSKKGIRNCKDV